MAIKRKLLTLDEAVLTGGSILAAGSGLPRRIGAASILSHVAAANQLGAVAVWGMDEAAGPTLVDSGPNGLNGTILAATYGNAGKDGLCLTTTGAGMASIPRNALLEPAYNQQFTVSFWFYGRPPTGSNFMPLGNAANSAGTPGWEISFDLSGYTFFALRASANQIYAGISSTWPLAQWNHVVFTYSGNLAGSGIKGYLNGIAVTMYTVSGGGLTAVTYGAPVTIGYRGSTGAGALPSGNRFDVLSLFMSELSAGAVATLYAGQAAPTVSARFTFDLGASRTIREVAIPGNLARGKSATVDSRLTKLYAAIAAGARVEYEPGVDLNLLATGGVVLDIDMAPATSPAPHPYVGGPNGEGPVVIYEEADPVATLDVTAVNSVDGYIDITLSSVINSAAAPTSAAAPAVQVTGATIPAPTVLRLATGPAYPGANISSVTSDATGITLVSDIPILSAPSASYAPFPATKVTGVTQPTATSLLLLTEPVPANVVSIANIRGRLSVAFDQPLGTGTVITNAPDSPIFVTGDSVLGNLLTLSFSAVTASGSDPVIGEVVTLPTPTIDSTHATGIFQGAIIIRSALIKALQELREDPTLIRDALASLPQDILTSKKYGEKTIDECVRWFTATNVPVKLGLSLTNLTSPCISVELTSSEEAESTLGDVDYNVIERDPWNPTQARQLASVHSREAYNVIMMVQGEPEFLLFLDTLVRFGILRHKEDLLDDRGFARLTWSVGPAGAMQDAPGRENFFARTLRLNGFARNCWPVAPKAGQPLGFIESTHFGPRVAPVAQNTDGTATSTPQTPTSPGPTGADPFDPAYWLDRDMVSGQQTNATGPLGVTDEPTLDLP